ncbi:MAG: hypothetical protein Q8P67_06915 [archaeon]|nr:hypothetical protein [archaeon]
MLKKTYDQLVQSGDSGHATSISIFKVDSGLLAGELLDQIFKNQPILKIIRNGDQGTPEHQADHLGEDSDLALLPVLGSCLDRGLSGRPVLVLGAHPVLET